MDKFKSPGKSQIESSQTVIKSNSDAEAILIEILDDVVPPVRLPIDFPVKQSLNNTSQLCSSRLNNDLQEVINVPMIP